MEQPNQPNYFKRYYSGKTTKWDILREVPFAGEKDSAFHAKEEMRSKTAQILEHYKDKPIVAKEFMQFMIGELQPILASHNIKDTLGNYSYWDSVLGELKPIFAGYWAECDPMMLQYLYMVFVAQFMVLLQLWSKLDFANCCIKDCAALGEFYLDVSVIDNDMLVSIANRWNILGEGRPNYLPL